MGLVTLVRTLPAMRSRLAGGQRPRGLVPTMGALHEGHLSLVKRARRDCGSVVVSIFVNPTQFGPGEDLKKYPRTLEADLRLLAQAGKVVVFAPSAEAMYPSGQDTTVRVEGVLTDLWEGKSRPGHFQGVATVVAKLFALIQPDKAYFGRKDYQQLAVIKQMAAGLLFPLEVIGCPTVRESDGLALSSRNRFLDQAERRQAP